MKQELIFMIGLVGSGKSTLSEKYISQGYQYHSSDLIREELFDDINSQVDNQLVFKTLHERVRSGLIDGNSVVLDATNLSMKRRRGFIRQYIDTIRVMVDVNVKAVVVATPFNECVRRDKARDRTVGYAVIDRMYKSFNFPLLQEGFDEIEIVYSDDKYEEFNLYKQLDFLKTVGQNNSNHTLTIGDHCEKVAYSFYDSSIEIEQYKVLFTSGLLHDFGKLQTMSFVNSKGEYSNQAHYYGHENVSAYDAMFYLKYKGDEIDTNKVCQIINYHMKSHLLKEDKSIKKFKKFVGKEFWNDLLIFNTADKLGR